MSKPLYCATDNEIFDTLMSAPQHFNGRELRNMGLRRGIIYSLADTRDELVDKLSTLHYGTEQIREIQEYFEYRGKGEKTKVIRLNQAFTPAEIRRATDTLIAGVSGDEKVYTAANGPSAIDVNVQFTEIDFGLVRLRQRQRREANINFEVSEGTTVVTLPAGVRAGSYFEELKKILVAERPEAPTVEAVNIAALTSALSRTKFFIELVGGLQGFTLKTVLKVDVERAHHSDRTLLEDDAEPGEDNSQEDIEMLGVVQGVALRGEDLLQSRVYQDLRRRHYYITSIRWRARLDTSPYPLVEFEAGFDEEAAGGAFRFGVLGRFNQKAIGQYNKTISPLPDTEKKQYVKALDEYSLGVFRALLAELSSRDRTVMMPVEEV